MRTIRPKIEKTVCTCESATESQSAISNMFYYVVENRNPYESKNRFCVRRTLCHICQGQWRQYVGMCACVSVYAVWKI